MKLAGWLFLMVVAMLAFTVGAEAAFGVFESRVVGAVAGATAGVAGAAVVLWSLRFATRGSRPVNLGSARGWAIGVGFGLLASVGAGLLVALSTGTPGVVELRVERFIGSLAPALLEEATMRGGVVHLLDVAVGPWAGLVGGSVPFGLLHLVSKIFGQPISFAHVIGTTAAGLLLSLLYLRWGLGAAVACHWLWNSLASSWRDVLGLGHTRDFEGAWETVGVLVVLCLVVAGVRRSWWRERISR